MTDLHLRIQKLEAELRWLLTKIDEAHEALCPEHVGSWKQRAKAMANAAKKLAKPCDKKQSDLRAQAVEVLAHLSALGKRKFFPKGTSLQLCMARMREKDVTVAGMKQMIDRQHQKWVGTDMEEYLQPSTLFRASKFVNYYAARELPVNAIAGKSKRADFNYDES